MMKHFMRRILCLLTALGMITAFVPALAGEGGYTLENIRDCVVGVDEPVTLEDGTSRPLINFDTAATTPALQPVVDVVNEKLLM